MDEKSKLHARYGYAIHTEKLIRPMGKITHIAKVTRMVDLHHQIDIPASGLGEAWGENATEASKKMQENVEKWIAAQGH